MSYMDEAVELAAAAHKARCEQLHAPTHEETARLTIEAAEPAIAEHHRKEAEAEGVRRNVRQLFAALKASTEEEGGTDGAAMIAAERQRQVEAEGWTPEHDDEHDQGELARAAAAYALVAGAGPTKQAGEAEALWPFIDGWKPGEEDVRNLTKAGALIAAEIDRLRRSTPPQQEEQTSPEEGGS